MLEPMQARVVSVDEKLLAEILLPYKQHCRYLKSASVEVPAAAGADAPIASARGQFEIPGSWYIDETGHFNSIEFNLCYNQLVYVLIGQCVRDRLVPAFASMTYDEYRRRQLPDVLIVEFSSTFRKAMDSRKFSGIVSIDRVSGRSRMQILKTRCEFQDADGGFSEGAITLAIVNRTNGAAAHGAVSG
jgi:hypothetical protein